MGNTAFTFEQQAELRKNANTLRVTENAIKYTYEFKCHVLSVIDEPGMTLRKVFTEAGYDVDMIGRNRIKAFLHRLRKEAASRGGLKPPKRTREEEMDAFAAMEMDKKQMRAAMKEMHSKIIYLEQEIEFLKKISQLRTTRGSSE